MQERKTDLPQEKDSGLDVPSEANTDKHINFRDVEDTGNQSSSHRKDKQTEERQRQWQEGLEEGRKLNNNG